LLSLKEINNKFDLMASLTHNLPLKCIMLIGQKSHDLRPYFFGDIAVLGGHKTN